MLSHAVMSSGSFAIELVPFAFVELKFSRTVLPTTEAFPVSTTLVIFRPFAVRKSTLSPETNFAAVAARSDGARCALAGSAAMVIATCVTACRIIDPENNAGLHGNPGIFGSA